MYRARNKGMHILLSNSQAGLTEQLSKSRKNFLSTTYKPLFRALYVVMLADKCSLLINIIYHSLAIGAKSIEGPPYMERLFVCPRSVVRSVLSFSLSLCPSLSLSLPLSSSFVLFSLTPMGRVSERRERWWEKGGADCSGKLSVC